MQAAASIADCHALDLGDLATGIDRPAPCPRRDRHAAGSHEHHHIARHSDGVPHPGDRLPPLVPWPQPNLQ